MPRLLMSKLTIADQPGVCWKRLIHRSPWTPHRAAEIGGFRPVGSLWLSRLKQPFPFSHKPRPQSTTNCHSHDETGRSAFAKSGLRGLVGSRRHASYARLLIGVRFSATVVSEVRLQLTSLKDFASLKASRRQARRRFWRPHRRGLWLSIALVGAVRHNQEMREASAAAVDVLRGQGAPA